MFYRNVIFVIDLVFLALLATVGILGNGLIIRVFAKKRQKTSTHIFILALAATDLASCFLFIGLMVWTAYVRFQVVSFCRVLYFLRRSLAVASAIQTTIIACDRYAHICNPWRFKFLRRNSKLIVTSGLAFGFLSQIHFAVHAEIISTGDSKICSYKGPIWLGGIAGLAVDLVFLTAIIFSSIAYGSIYWKIKRQRDRLTKRHINPSSKMTNKSIASGNGGLLSAMPKAHGCVHPSSPNVVSPSSGSSSSNPDSVSDFSMSETSDSSSATDFMKNIPSKGIKTKRSRTIRNITVEDVFSHTVFSNKGGVHTSEGVVLDHCGLQVRESTTKCKAGITSISAVVNHVESKMEPGPSTAFGERAEMITSSLNQHLGKSDKTHLNVSETLLKVMQERDSKARFISEDKKDTTNAWRKSRGQGHGSRHHCDKSQFRVRGDAMTKVLLINTIIFFITSLPVVILENFPISYIELLQKSFIGQWTVFLMYQLHGVNYVINGFVYFFVNRRFRRDAFEIFCQRGTRCTIFVNSQR